MEKSIAHYIRDNGAIQESNTPQQSVRIDAIQTDSLVHQLNIRIDELKGNIEKMENKHQEETMYWRDKIDNWEKRYDLQVLESNKKFDRLMESIDESRQHSYLPQNTGVRLEGIASTNELKDIDKVIEQRKEEETETKPGFWGRLFGISTSS